MTLLVVDVGTSGFKVAVIDGDGDVIHLDQHALPPSTPLPGLVELDAAQLAAAVLAACDAALASVGAVDAVGITAQRATTVLWDRNTGVPLGPALGWQDLRTVFDCLTLKAEHGLHLAPNQSATKLTWLLDTYDPDRRGDLCFGTVDCWLAWSLSRGTAHVTDHTNAAVTGMTTADAAGWDPAVLSALRVPEGILPAIVDTAGLFAEAAALRGAPPLAALVGDQQASLVGQGCVRPGLAKITFGTGAMLDVVRDEPTHEEMRRSPHGTFPIVAWSHQGELTWGAEGIMLAAGANVEWLRDDLGLIDSAVASHDVAGSCPTSDGVVYVPALMGLGTPYWDFGARGTLLGLTRGSGRAQIVRAVLEGVAQRAADLVEAAEADLGQPIDRLRIDGGMSANPTFVQALADATSRAVEVSAHLEATTIGAGYLAGLAVGTFAGLTETAEMWTPASVVEPSGSFDRDAWRRAVERAGGWIPDLSALDF
jgi:glycerol kinase